MSFELGSEGEGWARIFHTNVHKVRVQSTSLETVGLRSVALSTTSGLEGKKKGRGKKRVKKVRRT
ncbi:hypothetical protein P5673_015145 [Acropora cervicornis]|uniref:Uncharacterized protein n=1 Tax=Acropora cervicornis TaxID=6130 RepID=A0AAD9QI98_ACRCE|nr:hypothetical protein P5673_015145 [Acropora cervicornis]